MNSVTPSMLANIDNCTSVIISTKLNEAIKDKEELVNTNGRTYRVNCSLRASWTSNDTMQRWA